MPYQLTPAQLQQYDRDGYFIAPGLLSGEDVAAVRQAIEEAIAAPAEARSGNFDQELAARQGTALQERQRYRKLGQFARNSRVVVERGIGNENLLAIVRHFLGPDLVLLYDSVFLKPARVGGATPWHQDIGLWPDKVRQSLNFWTAIDPATRENGCMQFVPGSHRGPIIEHVQYADVHKELPRELVQNVQAKHIELESGDTVFWHSNLWHYSGPNRSERDRIAIAGVYINPQGAAGVDKARGLLLWMMRDGVRCKPPLPAYQHDASPAGPSTA